MASKEIHYKEQPFQLSYELVNPTQDKVLLVLHGWGSNKEIMKQAFGKTLPDFKHIYLDMPGFGKSINEMILTTQDYANIVQLFLDELGVTVKIATFKLLKPLGMKKIRELFVAPDAQGMSHEMYETFKNVVDEDFESSFAKSKSKALCFWGKEDTATPLYTGEKIAGLIENSEFYPLEGDHFFFLTHKDFIAKTITEQCKDIMK